MAPKPKKTKEQIEEERRLAEEERRIAEEERLRLEAEERKLLEEQERQRQELLAVMLRAEMDRCEHERLDIVPVAGQREHERAKAREQRRKDREWERYLSCLHVPHPKDRIAMANFITSSSEASDSSLSDTRMSYQDCCKIIEECEEFEREAYLDHDKMAQGMHLKDIDELHGLITTRSDRASARILHFADEHANERGEIQMGLAQGSFQFALWVNTSKNPRMKTVEMPQMNLVIDIPKQIALASVSMRVQHRSKDEFFHRCTNSLMAMGGVLYVDLLTLPPPSKKVRQWVLRQVTPLAHNIQRIPYPIPPAGADPDTYRSEEEPPPLGFTYPFMPNIVLLDNPIQVGWWDSNASAWSTEGVSGASVDCATGNLTFQTTHLGQLAVVKSRSQLFPYRSWCVRPTGGRGGASAAVSLDLGLPEGLLVIEAGSGWVQVHASTVAAWPQMHSLSGRHLQPQALLLELSALGFHVMPEDRDAVHSGVALKQCDVEESMCSELALLCGAFLISRSKWNQSVAADECIARVSEVLDWEEGGRTEQSHLDRIFSKEKEDGERRVLAVMQRGKRGFAFCDALDRRAELPQLPGHETIEGVQACLASVWGEVHAGLPTLLKGPTLTSAELEAGPLPRRLRATPEGLELVGNTDPLLTETVGQLLFLLRVFSFS